MTIFVLEDEMHSDRLGEFRTEGETWRELQRVVALPFDQAPNLPPCTKGLACRRAYEIAEYDDSTVPWRELSRTYVVELTAQGASWKMKPPETFPAAADHGK